MIESKESGERRKVLAAIPAYDAGPWVGDVVRRTTRQIEDVLVVDDGSSDETARVARAAGAEVISHRVNRGKGAALLTAFSVALARGYDAIATLDADGQHLPERLPDLVAAWQGGADLVLGSRFHLFMGMSPLRRASNRLSSRAISWAAGQPIGDVQTGFRIYSRELLERVGFLGAGFEAESAVVVRASRMGLEVREVPIELGFVDGRSTSHYRPIADSLRIARAVAGARFFDRPDAPNPLAALAARMPPAEARNG